MTERTTETTVTFRRPFVLTGLDRAQPPGTYRVDIDEEQIPGVLFFAWRRTATVLHVPAVDVRRGPQQTYSVDAAEFAAAIASDAES